MDGAQASFELANTTLSFTDPFMGNEFFLWAWYSCIHKTHFLLEFLRQVCALCIVMLRLYRASWTGTFLFTISPWSRLGLWNSIDFFFLSHFWCYCSLLVHIIPIHTQFLCVIVYAVERKCLTAFFHEPHNLSRLLPCMSCGVMLFGV